MQLRGCSPRRRADRAKEKELSLISTFKERLDAGHRAPDNDDLFSITASIVRSAERKSVRDLHFSAAMNTY